ncbi:MAG: DUF5013 domain-containing protein [Prevotellaceae bacterium]|nr:DUF5013 domain-containing protein [Prevotellaceae bacterium]
MKVNDNTGYYNREAWAAMRATVDNVLEQLNGMSADDSENTYYALTKQWEDYLANAKNKGGLVDVDGSQDITIEALKENKNFSRANTSVKTRFATPLYWTVENFNIPNGSDGVKNGLDKYEGTDALMLGVWNDRGNNTNGDLKNARIYQKVTLEAGRYFWGASFNALYQLNQAYIFVSDALLPTSEMETSSLAYININECDKNGQTYGLYFTLEQPQEVYIGFQADLSAGSATQEFRAETISLLTYNGGGVVGVQNIEADTLSNTPAEFFTLQGIRLNAAPHSGFYIVRKGSATYKYYKQ